MRDPADARVRLVALTERGWAAVAGAREHRAALVAELAERLGARRVDAAVIEAIRRECRAPGQAIGWALRAYAWVDPDEVERYCAAHELSSLSRREALRNLDQIRAA